jgi:hypothetical protein
VYSNPSTQTTVWAKPLPYTSIGQLLYLSVGSGWWWQGVGPLPFLFFSFLFFSLFIFNLYGIASLSSKAS